MSLVKKEREPSNPNVHVHVTERTKSVDLNGKRSTLTIAMIATLITIIAGSLGILSTYVFATKPEVAALKTSEELTDASVKELQKDVDEIKADMKDVEREQRLTNKNLEKLLIRSRIEPARREDIRLEDP